MFAPVRLIRGHDAVMASYVESLYTIKGAPRKDDLHLSYFAIYL